MGHTVETKKAILLDNIAKQKERLAKTQQKVEEAIESGKEYRIESLQRYINDLNNTIYRLESTREFVRECTPEDIEERLNVFKTFSDTIKKVIPDGTSIVFHGSNNIGIIRKILETGGLLTPDQRGCSMTSFAAQIDVTYKDYVQTSVEFAEPGATSLNPYGAIFAFIPLESEYEKVISTGSSTEVYGGVEGVNFREQPERLIGIITTNENKERIISWCIKYHIEPKVFTHEEFINYCKENYKQNNK